MPFRSLLPFAVAAICAGSCSDPRGSFTIPDPLPLFQVLVDEEGAFGGKRGPEAPLEAGIERVKRASEGGESRTFRPDLSAGLAVPVTQDGYCLTAAHNVAGRDPFVLLDLRAMEPRFLVGDRKGTPVTTALRADASRPGELTRAPEREERIEVITGPLDRSGFDLVKQELGDMDRTFLLPAEVVKIWEGEDLALIQLPFPTPVHFTMAGNVVSTRDLLMFLGNPLVHGEGPLTGVDRVDEFPRGATFAGGVVRKFDVFYPILFKGNAFIRQGDSGGALINRRGELVGIHSGAGGVGGSGVTLCIGIRAEVVREAIREKEGAAEK